MPVPEKPPAASRRTALVIVIIMSTFFVLALLGVIWGFVRQAKVFMAARDARAQVATPSAAAPAMPGAAAAIWLAPGSRIISASTDAGKLVLHVSTASGGEVEIIDLQTGKLTGQVKTNDGKTH
jgi:hypothetical protein